MFVLLSIIIQPGSKLLNIPNMVHVSARDLCYRRSEMVYVITPQMMIHRQGIKEAKFLT